MSKKDTMSHDTELEKEKNRPAQPASDSTLGESAIKIFEDGTQEAEQEAEVNGVSAAASQKAAEEQKKRLRRRKAKKIRKIVFFSLIALAVVAGAAYYFFWPKSNGQGGNAPNTYTVSRQDITQKLTGTGTVQPVDSYSVTGLVKGEVLEAPFEEGDVLQKGDLLFKIDSSSVESSIERAQFSLERAQLNYDELLDSLDDLKLISDYSGRVQKLYVEIGDTVNAGTVIADILDKENMLVDIPFFASDADSFRIGDPATVTVDSTLEQLSGTVKEISPIDSVSDNGATIKNVTISVRNPGGITETTRATASVNGITCFAGANFYYNVSETIQSKGSGEITTLNLEEGKWVSKGAKVMELTNKTLENQIKSSKLSLQDAESSLQSVKDQLDDYNITSPISGTVVAKNFKAGDNIDSTSANQPLAVIYDMSALTFDLNVDELDIGNITLGQDVKITSDAREGEVYHGKVTKISIQGSTQNGITSYPVTVTIDEVGDLLPGMNVDAEIIVQEAKDVLAIPMGAVMRGNTVKRVTSQVTPQVTSQATDEPQNTDSDALPDGAAPSGMPNGGPGAGDVQYEVVPVELGINDDDFIEVKSGLKEGDVIIVENQSAGNMGGFYGGKGMGGGMIMVG